MCAHGDCLRKERVREREIVIYIYCYVIFGSKSFEEILIKFYLAMLSLSLSIFFFAQLSVKRVCLYMAPQSPILNTQSFKFHNKFVCSAVVVV